MSQLKLLRANLFIPLFLYIYLPCWCLNSVHVTLPFLFLPGPLLFPVPFPLSGDLRLDNGLHLTDTLAQIIFICFFSIPLRQQGELHCDHFTDEDTESITSSGHRVKTFRLAHWPWWGSGVPGGGIWCEESMSKDSFWVYSRSVNYILLKCWDFQKISKLFGL